jgi:nitroimidazol reductase NimA-like FMN-containing flavoprotein (pyridoxamine 5'-phosphate oxidase superfamily)
MATKDGRIDKRFSDPKADAARWPDVERLLQQAELYWLTTVRADGRPHVTPLIGLWHDGAAHFVTGADEQKARNLEHDRRVALTTGANRWAEGMDVVVEGSAARVTGGSELQAIADAYVGKYGEDWRFEVGDGAFVSEGESPALVFRVDPAKVLAFAKDPHGQTTFRLS